MIYRILRKESDGLIKEMKESEDNIIPQDDLVLVEEKKKEPISRFFQEMKNDIDKFSEDSGDFFL